MDGKRSVEELCRLAKDCLTAARAASDNGDRSEQKAQLGKAKHYADLAVEAEEEAAELQGEIAPSDSDAQDLQERAERLLWGFGQWDVMAAERRRLAEEQKRCEAEEKAAKEAAARKAAEPGSPQWYEAHMDNGARLWKAGDKWQAYYAYEHAAVTGIVKAQWMCFYVLSNGGNAKSLQSFSDLGNLAFYWLNQAATNGYADAKNVLAATDTGFSRLFVMNSKSYRGMVDGAITEEKKQYWKKRLEERQRFEAKNRESAAQQRAAEIQRMKGSPAASNGASNAYRQNDSDYSGAQDAAAQRQRVEAQNQRAAQEKAQRERWEKEEKAKRDMERQWGLRP